MVNINQWLQNSLGNFFATLTNKKAILIISILGIIVFGNSLGNGFVGDDIPQMIDYPQMQSITNMGGFFTGQVSTNTNYYKPIFNTINALIFTYFGPRAIAFHFFSIILHIYSVIFLFLILIQFFKKPLALVLALIFLVHPLNSEVVFYAADLQDVLFFFFGILGLYKLTRAKSIGSIVVVTFLFFLSILSKETGALFFPVAMIYVLLYNRKYVYQLLGLLGFTGLIYFALRMNAIGFFNLPLNTPIAELDFWGRILHIPAILFFYLKTFFYPMYLSASYYWIIGSLNIYNFYIPLIVDLLILGLITYLGVKLFKKDRLTYFKPYLFFSLCLIIGLSLHIQIVPLDATVADRWFYFPMVGVLGIIGTLFQAYNINLNHKFIITFIVAILLLFSTRTFVRSFDWRDELTLATHDAMVSESHVLEITIANNLIKQGKVDEAKEHAVRAVKIYPNFTSYNTLGIVYTYLGDYGVAVAAYEKALELGQYQIFYENLSFAYLMGNDLDKAESFTEEALKKYPSSVKLWFRLAIIEYKLGRLDKAKSAIMAAYQLEPTQGIKMLYDAIISGRKGLEFNLIPE
ncbi:MAG: hypothetical protein A2588_01955 [Candidatus Veblenbacteria bacterium RIFOXYD1_FULL_43_11]|uniref:Glycosyltransferase RgtA/B/C/D-like domain-containing protein n=1 Tax=Candidatus Veblenbacteria bacterium RIFOXYD1_FULL_43_11 TaxID=1802429 RepID=A0A1G2Q9P8_9BACT|nr:MAG: hypothetical protein A2588_01955 [Candidatus Veblenbacteria bacterium RIFOXYD1_FULL_43_11]